MGSTVLIISPESWDAHFVSKHHYARELAQRGHRVIFYGPPDKLGGMRLVRVTDAKGELHVLHAPRVALGLRFMPSILRRVLEARWLKRVEQVVGSAIDVVWNFENSRFFDMRFSGARLKIYHQVDLNQNYQPEIAARTADYVFCTSKPIRNRLSVVRKDVAIINHGVNFVPTEPLSESALFTKDSLNCLYVGNLSMKYLDREIILRCVKQLPEVCFNFVGGFDKDDPFQQALAEYPNVRLHGKVVSSRILAILSNADVLMVVYQKKHFEDQSNPHKMMEYMMSGKVIVATHTSEYTKVSNLLAMAGPDDDYVDVLERVVANLKHYNSDSLATARRTFALENTYDKQLDRITQALGPRGALIS